MDFEVRQITRVEEFEALRPAWDKVFDQDPYASPFLSWSWMRGWRDVTPYPSSVLAVRESAASAWTGFWPISIRGSQGPFRIDQVREIHMGGSPGADYTGFLCVPGHDHAMMRAIVDYLLANELKWDRLRFADVNDPRLDLLFGQLPQDLFRLDIGTGATCPYISLPETWDAYLQEKLSYDTRKSLRKKLRMFDDELRVTHLDGSNRDQQIDALVSLAGMRKHDTPNDNLPRCRSLFQSCADAGIASVIIIWHGETPIAGMGSFIDHKVKSLGTYLTGFDDRFANYSPGRIVNAVTIRHAIEQKYKVLDFLRGDEPYKMQFGAQLRNTRTAMAIKRGLNTATRMAMHRMRERLHI